MKSNTNISKHVGALNMPDENLVMDETINDSEGTVQLNASKECKFFAIYLNRNVLVDTPHSNNGSPFKNKSKIFFFSNLINIKKLFIRIKITI